MNTYINICPDHLLSLLKKLKLSSFVLNGPRNLRGKIIDLFHFRQLGNQSLVMNKNHLSMVIELHLILINVVILLFIHAYWILFTRADDNHS